MSFLKVYEYYNSNSVIHRINPVVKIIWLAVFSVLVLISDNLYYIFTLLIVTLVAQALTKIPFAGAETIYRLFVLFLNSFLYFNCYY